MTKRVVSLILAVILPITLFTGCKKRLSEEEYLGQVKAAYEEYAAALEEFESVRADVSASQEIMEEHTKAVEICDRAETTLKKFAKLYPPEELSEQHEELIDAAELEQKFIYAQRKVLSARTPDELSTYISEYEAVFSGVPEERQLPAVIRELL